MQEVGGGFKAIYNVGRKNGPGILPLLPFAKPPRPPVPYIFYEAFISQAWCAGEVITHTLKTVSDFLRVRMAQQLDLSSESIPLPHYSSLFFFLLCAQSWDHSSSHTYNSSVWSDGEPDGNGFFFSGFTDFQWWQQQGQDKVKSMKYFLLPLIALYTHSIIHIKLL